MNVLLCINRNEKKHIDRVKRGNRITKYHTDNFFLYKSIYNICNKYQKVNTNTVCIYSKHSINKFN